MLESEESNNPVFNYGQLFADPNSEVWTRNGVRLQLSSYLADQSWGRNKQKLRVKECLQLGILKDHSGKGQVDWV